VKLIRFTYHNGSTIMINPDSVSFVTPATTGCSIGLFGFSREIVLRESVEEAVAKLCPETTPTRAEKKGDPLRFDHDTGCWDGITPDDRSRWGTAYPACNLDIELTKMAEWLRTAGAAGKKRDWRGFVNRWLGRCQRHGGSLDVARAPAPATTDQEREYEEWRKKHGGAA
jgi:hypothetical protein